ncbi:putative DNA binding domain-containing protein [Patescibacteria group bacterium]|nr:putative DNA binding domain-containing protein [Patescibacteria group bacterium]
MALPINIQKLIARETVESERIEFKKGWNPQEIIHSICAFANDINNWGGGYIILGIEEKNGVPQLPPVGLETNQIDSYQRKLIEVCHIITPSCTPIVSPEIHQEKQILVIYVPGGDNRPYRAPRTFGDGRSEKVFWVKKGSASVIADEQDRQKLLELANKVPFDDRICHQASIDELSLPLMQSFLKEVGSKLYQQSSKMSFGELCRKMNIAKGATENLRPLNVGLLLFTEKPDKYFRGCITELIVYKDEVGDEFEESKFIGPVHDQLRNSLNYIKSNIIKEKIVKVEGVAESIRNYNYPYSAVEEALANAIYHRSYEHQSSIEINIRSDKIEILSFPGPLPPVNNKMLKQDKVIARDYRNRRIGDFLKELHLTEGRGTGFPKIRKSMKKNGSPDPTFKTDANSTYFLTVLPCNYSFVDLELDDYKKSILIFCQKEKSRREIMEYIGLENRQENAKKHLQPLIDSNYIKYLYPHVPQTPKQKYIITDKGKFKLKS